MPHKFTINVDGRIDVVLAQMEVISRSAWKKPNFQIYIDGQLVTKRSSIVKIGQTGEIVWLQKPEVTGITPSNQPLKIVYEDSWLLVVDKPAGLIIYPAHQETDSLAARVLNHLHQQNNHSFDHSERPGIVHRLDQDTSGLVLVAKTEAVLQQLSQLFQNRSVIKHYYALVQNPFKQTTEFLIDKPIGHSDNGTTKMSCQPGAKGQKPAQTLVCTRLNFTKTGLIECQLITGRTHQIRVHLASIGHPLVGDTLYGYNGKNNLQHCLQCHYLAFKHPVTGQMLQLKLPIANWKKFYV